MQVTAPPIIDSFFARPNANKSGNSRQEANLNTPTNSNRIFDQISENVPTSEGRGQIINIRT